MLYYKFQNYEEFKSIFGIQYHGNGSNPDAFLRFLMVLIAKVGIILRI